MKPVAGLEKPTSEICSERHKVFQMIFLEMSRNEETRKYGAVQVKFILRCYEPKFTSNIIITFSDASPVLPGLYYNPIISFED